MEQQNIPSWLHEVRNHAEEFKKSDLYSNFTENINTKDLTDDEIMDAASGVYFQWLGIQIKSRNGASKTNEHCNLMYIPPPDYNKEEHTGNFNIKHDKKKIF